MAVDQLGEFGKSGSGVLIAELNRRLQADHLAGVLSMAAREPGRLPGEGLRLGYVAPRGRQPRRRHQAVRLAIGVGRVSTPLHLGKRFGGPVDVAGSGQRLGVVDAEVVGTSVGDRGEFGDRMAKAFDGGAQVPAGQCRSAADRGGERLGAAGNVGALLVGAVRDRQGLRDATAVWSGDIRR